MADEILTGYEHLIEEIASNFIKDNDEFKDVTPTSVEIHFGAMQLSTAISLKRIADLLQFWIGTHEKDNQEELDEAYSRGFDDGQNSSLVEPTSEQELTDAIDALSTAPFGDQKS